MRARWIVAVSILVLGTAVADRKQPSLQDQLGAQLAGYHAEGSGDQPPLFVFTGHDHVAGAWGSRYSGGSFGEIYEMAGKPTVGLSTDQTVAWVAVDSRELISCVDAATYSGQGDAYPCPAKNRIIERDDGTYAARGIRHTTGLFVKTKKGWTPYAYHIGIVWTAKEQAEALKKSIKLDPIKRTIGGAGELVAVFEKSIGSTKTLAKTISDRTDVLLYGSEPAERYLGQTVKQTLDKWDLKIKVTGLHAGVASKTVGFVAATIEATAGKGKPSPYRLLAIYEKSETWKVVQLHFSFPEPTS